MFLLIRGAFETLVQAVAGLERWRQRRTCVGAESKCTLQGRTRVCAGLNAHPREEPTSVQSLNTYSREKSMSVQGLNTHSREELASVQSLNAYSWGWALAP